MAKITYEDKVAINENAEIADINKCKASDLNEIKSVVNTNDDNTNQNSNNIGNIENLNTTNKNNLVESINEVYQNNIYSEDEQVIGKWIDDKTLYRKVISSPGLSPNTIKNIPYNIENLDKIWIENGFIYSAARVITLPEVGYNGQLDSKTDVWIEKKDNTVNLYSNGGWGNEWTFYIILNYTKTTD